MLCVYGGVVLSECGGRRVLGGGYGVVWIMAGGRWEGGGNGCWCEGGWGLRRLG